MKPGEEVEARDAGYVPESGWRFDDEVTRVFSDMLSRSIPQYEVMRRAVFDVGCRFVAKGTDVVDLGCSNGESLKPFVEKFAAYNTYIGVEISEPMIEAARKNFKGYTEEGNGLVKIRKLDLRNDFPPCRPSLVLSVLTLQFVPINYRQNIIEEVHDRLLRGGAFIVVEKVLGAGALIDEMMIDIYHQMKRESGYSGDEVNRKMLSLEGVLVPVTAEWNVQALENAGFQKVDSFWRWMNFCAWVAIKG